MANSQSGSRPPDRLYYTRVPAWPATLFDNSNRRGAVARSLRRESKAAPPTKTCKNRELLTNWCPIAAPPRAHNIMRNKRLRPRRRRASALHECAQYRVAPPSSGAFFGIVASPRRFSARRVRRTLSTLGVRSDIVKGSRASPRRGHVARAGAVARNVAEVAMRYDCFHLVLMVTHACNLRCDYCYMGRKSPRRCCPAIGRSAIARAVCSIRPSGVLELGFFGGEPLLEAELITGLLSHARHAAESAGVVLRPTLTTNGTIATAAAWDVMTDDGLDLCISHDGLPEVHDRHRNGEWAGQRRRSAGHDPSPAGAWSRRPRGNCRAARQLQ